MAPKSDVEVSMNAYGIHVGVGDQGGLRDLTIEQARELVEKLTAAVAAVTMAMKVTDELVVGDTVATSKVGAGAVQRAAPGQQGAWRTIESIEHIEGRHPSRDMIVRFTDGTVAAAQRVWYWRTKEV